MLAIERVELQPQQAQALQPSAPSSRQSARKLQVAGDCEFLQRGHLAPALRQRA